MKEESQIPEIPKSMFDLGYEKSELPDCELGQYSINDITWPTGKVERPHWLDGLILEE